MPQARPVKRESKARPGRAVASSKTSTRRTASKRTTRTSAAEPTTRKRASPKQRWSANVTEHSDALDLDEGVFKLRSARAIASSIKHSAEQSQRRKSEPYRSAMSMLSFYVNRAGRNLTPTRLRTLERAKVELRKLFGRAPD